MEKLASPYVTADMAAEIKYLYYSVGLYQHQIAAKLGVNQGRVSEVITGKRHPQIAAKDQPAFSF